MLSTFRSKLTYANVVATLALFIALGGSSYAAISLTKNSVRSKHIGKGQVKRSDLGKNAVTSRKVANFSLRAVDFKRGQLPAGPRGMGGPAGPQGDQGLPGEAGTAVAYAFVDEDGQVESGRSKNITQSNVDPDTATGTVCFTDVPSTWRNVIATASHGAPAGQDDVIATANGPGAFAIGNCSGRFVVKTFDVNAGALQDRPFFVWFED